jgi:hypothetical protein
MGTETESEARPEPQPRRLTRDSGQSTTQKVARSATAASHSGGTGRTALDPVIVSPA